MKPNESTPKKIEPTPLEKNGLVFIPRLFMQMWGMWPLHLLENKTHRIWYGIYRAFLFGYYFTFFVLLLIECIRLINGKKFDFERTAQSCGLLFIILILMCKAIIYQKKEIPKMCLSVIEVEKEIWRSNKEDVQDLYRKILLYNKYLNIGVIVSSICVVVSFSFLSFWELCNVGLNQWNFEEKSFMYEVYFPLNKTIYFPLVVMVNVSAGFLGIILNIACQSILYSLIIFAVLRLIFLQIRIRKFDEIAIDLSIDVETAIKGFIQEHQNTIRFVEQLNDSTRYVMLLEFILNSFNTAALSYQIITVKSAMAFAYPLCHLSLIILQVFVLGWTANEINIQSLALADAIYESPWYKQNQSAKQMLLIMIMRAQKPLALTIGPFNAMTIDTAIKTMRAAYSYVTLMTNTYYEQDE